MKNFWQKLKESKNKSGEPIFVLAPMADVTDCAFREIIAKYGRHGEDGGGPDVFWTEFVSVDGLLSRGRDSLLHDFRFGKNEKPIVAQIFGNNPDNFYKIGELIKELDFDGIDINMGCPDKSIEKQGAGASLIKDKKRAKEIIEATKEGSFGLPVSVKTRIGYNKEDIDDWIGSILETKISALTVHLRTRKEMSLVDAHWDLMPKVVSLAKNYDTVILGNGDVSSLEDGREKVRESGCDGVMLGRAIFGNPWLFDSKIKYSEIDLKERLRVMIEHTKLFEEKLGGIKSFSIMKKHYKAYVNNFDGAKELRVELMGALNSNEVEKIVNDFLKKF